MDKLIDNLPEILNSAVKSNLGTFALLAIVLSVLAYYFFAKASIWARIGIFILLFAGVTGFSVAMLKETPLVDDTEYIRQPYTTGGDGRKTRSLTCPEGKTVVPNTAKCMSTASGVAIKSELIGTNTWRCEWPYQAPGVGIWIEMACKTPK